MKKLLAAVILVLGVLLLASGCSSSANPSTANSLNSSTSTQTIAPNTTSQPASTPAPGSKGPVVVASKIDTEGGLLGQMIILMLQSKGFQTTDKTQLGPTQLVRQAIISSQIDIYPEYTGNGAFFFANAADAAIWKDAAKGYQQVKTLDKQQNNIVWLQPAPANNTWAIAIPKSLSDKENIHSLVDLATYVNKGGVIKLAGSEEFVTSDVALPAFAKAYGFTLKQDQLVTFAGGNTAQTEKAAADGTSGVNAAMAYGTDGSLAALNLVVLDDPKGVQPVYAPAAIVRGAIYDKYPELADILNPVFKTLDLTTLQTLNGKIALQGQSAADVARSYLNSRSFLK